MITDPLMLLPTAVMTALGPFVLVAEIACIVHAVKNGRPYWWIWLLLGFPVVGVLAYLALEVQPSFRTPDVKGATAGLLWWLKGPDGRRAALEAELEESSTVHNRLRLARELVEQQRYDRACEVLEGGLRGPNKAHAELLLRLGEALLSAGRVDAAAEVLARPTAGESADALFRRSLVEARLLEAQGRADEAEARLREIVAKSKEEIARVELAAVLVRRGRREEGLAIADEVTRRYRKGTRVWRFQEKAAFDAAKRLRKSPAAAPAKAAA